MSLLKSIKKAFVALSDRQILPIFLLYFITSAAFLVFFAQMFYEREKHFILDRDVFIVRDLQHHLQNKLQKNGEIDDDDFDDDFDDEDFEYDDDDDDLDYDDFDE